MIRPLSILSLFVCMSIGLLGQSAIELFEEANTLYEQENYAGSIKIYEAIVNDGNVSPELYHNLGNAYSMADQKGEAMLAFERGLKLDPNHSSLIADREVVKEGIESDIFEVPPFAPIRYWRAFTKLLAPNLWVLLQLLSLGFIIFYLSQQWLKPYKVMPSWMNMIKTTSIILVVLSTLALLSLWHQKHNQVEAIVLSDTQLYIGPDERSGEVNPIPEGEKVAILEDFEGWWKVQLLNLEEGYVQKTVAEKI